MRILNFYQQLKLKAKITLVFFVVIAVLFTTFGLIVYFNRISTITKDTESRMQEHLNNMVNLLDYSTKNKHLARIEIINTVQSILDNINKDSVIAVFDTSTIVVKTKQHNEKTLLPEADYIFLKNWFNTITIYESGYPFLVNHDGTLIIDQTLENKSIVENKLFKEMSKKNEGNYQCMWPDEEEGKKAWIFFKYYEPYKIYFAVVAYEKEYLSTQLRKVMMLAVFSLIFAFILFGIIIHFLTKSVTTPLNCINEVIKKLTLGQLTTSCEINRSDEIGEIASNVNLLIDGLKATAAFAKEIEKGNFTSDFKPLSKQDILGNSLLDMRASLQHAALEEEKRKIEDEKRNWATVGIAKFSEILRKNNDNMAELSFDIISNLVMYLNANQGGIFIVNDDDPANIYLEMTACYAYDRQKFLEKKVLIGEGLVGTCFQEKKTIHLEEIPEDYISITSGLGQATPRSIIIIPLKVNEEIYGIIEIASFKSFEPHEIEFVEKIGESIASTISSVKINARTAFLLEQSQLQAEEMKAQEEEMRQNMEEMHATQEELGRKNAEMAAQEMETRKTLQDLLEKQYEFESLEQEYKERIVQLTNELEQTKEELNKLKQGKTD